MQSSNKLLSSSKRIAFIPPWPFVKLCIILLPVREPPVQITLFFHVFTHWNRVIKAHFQSRALAIPHLDAYSAKITKKSGELGGVCRLCCCSQSLVTLLKVNVFIGSFIGTIIERGYAPSAKKNKQTNQPDKNKLWRQTKKGWVTTYLGYCYYSDTWNHYFSREHVKVCRDVYWMGW